MAYTKLSELTALNSQAVADLVYVVDISAGTSGSKKSTLTTLFGEIVAPVVIKTANGIDYTPGSDVDVDIATVNVTGTPKIWWDESADAITINKLLNIGDVAATNSVYPMVNVNRVVQYGTSQNAHAYSDSSTLTIGHGYNSFDARVEVDGSDDWDHVASFQASTVIGTSGTIDDIYGLFCNIIVNTGTVTNNYGIYVDEQPSSGVITNQYGLYIEELTEGATINYAIETAGSTLSKFGGHIAIGVSPGTAQCFRIGGAEGANGLKMIDIDATNTGTSTTVLNVEGSTTGSANSTTVIGNYNHPAHASSGTVNNFYNIYSGPTTTGGAITTMYHLFVTAATGGGTVTTEHGVYVASDIPSTFKGDVFMHVPNSAPTVANNAELVFYLDESGHNLKAAVKYADGTAKTLTVAFD